MTDLVLASLHHLLVFALVALLAAELVLLRPGLSGEAIARLARLDRAYGGVALLVLLAGFGRVFLGLKGWEYYVYGPLFWVKIAVFLAVGALSVPPTLAILRWNRAGTAAAAEIAAARRFLHAEAAILAAIPVIAAAMARGYLM